MIKTSDTTKSKKQTHAKEDKGLRSKIYDNKFRPKTLQDMVGRAKEKEKVLMMLNAARSRGEVLDHILFYGPPGLGKTTFALAIANELQANLHVTSGPAITKQGDLAAILTSLQKNDVLFIDEIHRLPRAIEEIIYPAMEDMVVDIVMGKGQTAKTIRLPIQPFTLIGATTQIAKLSAPLRDRFGLLQRLEYYEVDELAELIRRACALEQVSMTDDAIKEIAARSRGTARIALRLFKRVRDYAHSRQGAGDIKVTQEGAVQAMDLFAIDKYGLDKLDRDMLRIMADSYGGGPVGLGTLAAALSEDQNTIADLHEPYLMQLGFIKRTSQGRVLTQKGAEYISGMQSFI